MTWCVEDYRMIRTDKVVCRTRTQEEYYWLMDKLEEYGFMWAEGKLPTEVNNWRRYFTQTCINFKDKIMMFADFDFYKNKSDYKDYKFIEVSGLMKDEEVQKILETIYNADTIEVRFE